MAILTKIRSKRSHKNNTQFFSVGIIVKKYKADCGHKKQLNKKISELINTQNYVSVLSDQAIEKSDDIYTNLT